MSQAIETRQSNDEFYIKLTDKYQALGESEQKAILDAADSFNKMIKGKNISKT